MKPCIPQGDDILDKLTIGSALLAAHMRLVGCFDLVNAQKILFIQDIFIVCTVPHCAIYMSDNLKFISLFCEQFKSV